MTTNDMTPANAIIAPLTLLSDLTPQVTGALIILINELNPQPEEIESIEVALTRHEGDSPKQVAVLRHELYRHLR